MMYSGVEKIERAQAEVAVNIDGKWRNKIPSYTYVSERITTSRLKIERCLITIIGVYAPEGGRTDDTHSFYDLLQIEISKYKNRDHLIIAGELKCRRWKSTYP